MTVDGRWILTGSRDKTLRLWELDWEYEFPGWADWDEAAERYLSNFLTLHTPYAGTLSNESDSTDEEVLAALTRAGKPTWSDRDFDNLIARLQHAGYGWLRPEGVRKKLEEMAADWNGPPPLPSQDTSE
jgi:hypothetical protein